MRTKFFLIGLLFLTGVVNAQKVKVSGSITGGNYTEISVLDLENNEITTADIGKDQKFDVSFNAKQEDIYLLALSQDDVYLLVTKPGEKINITIDTKSDTPVVSGSPGTSLYYNELSKLIGLQSDQEVLDAISKLMNDNKGELAIVPFAINLDATKYNAEHKKFLASLSKHKGTFIVDEYSKIVNSVGKTDIGSIAPEISLQNPDGKIIKLSSLRGKYVLIDFWASWCRPCRAENPNVVKAYNKFKNKGFTVYGVSLDENKSSWTAAIAKDKLEQWPHVSDLKGWSSSAGKLYGVRSIPSNFLIDPQGKIIAKNLRGEKLEEKLEEVLK